jgi:hypothetical protein
MNAASGSIHAAAWADASGRIGWVREDVGRHNALDKLIGALHHNEHAIDGGLLVISSRASYEMVSKACAPAPACWRRCRRRPRWRSTWPAAPACAWSGSRGRAGSMCIPIPSGCRRTTYDHPVLHSTGGRPTATRARPPQRSATFGKSTGTSNATLT